MGLLINYIFKVVQFGEMNSVRFFSNSLAFFRALSATFLAICVLRFSLNCLRCSATLLIFSGGTVFGSLLEVTCHCEFFL